MANSIDLFNKIVYFLITGASRGIGKTMAIETSKNFAPGSVVVLLARSQSGLEDTRSKIMESNAGIKVIIKSIDLTKPSVEEYDEIIADSFDKSVKYDQAMIIHNVGTLGDVAKWSTDIENYKELENYFSINVFAPTILNNRLLKRFPIDLKKFVVNVTSKAGLTPFKSFTFYCMGKAAREMYFRCLAEEFPNLLILNYSPGPVESEMTVYAQNSSASSEVSGMFKNLRDQGTILTTEMTTRKFLDVVKAGKYVNGGHVDYYDDL
ncbi:sepiapterin reductase-like [Chironomus tepperi]|uniref:sepiapterin reductase-like n=1 Tax=Chironomus tepperi TaxID=113505 RepID=UPI00391F6398